MDDEELSLDDISHHYSTESLTQAGYPEWYANAPAEYQTKYDGKVYSLETINEVNGGLNFEPTRPYSPATSDMFQNKGLTNMERLLPIGKREGVENIVTSSRARNSLGQAGRSITNDRRLSQDLADILKAALLENYDRLVKEDTGALRESIARGDMRVDAETRSYTFVLRTIQGRPRHGNESRPRPNTAQYGPLVFQGRKAIIAPNGMRFFSMGEWHFHRMVRAALPRNIFEFTTNQKEKLDIVIIKGITDEIREWLDGI